jgi:MYXO-CTERM domain-containing protein
LQRDPIHMRFPSDWYSSTSTLAATLLTVGVLWPTPTRAESPYSPCTRAEAVHPDAYTRLPRNAPALVFVPPAGWFAFDGSANDYLLSLEDPDGNVVATTFSREGERTLIRPTRPLQGMRALLRYRDVCRLASPTLAAASVELDVEAPLPEVIGSLHPGSDARRAEEVPWNATCTPPAAAVHVPLEIKMSPALAAYRGVARWEVSYRGRTRAYDHGELGGSQSDGSVRLLLDDDCSGLSNTGGPLEVKVHVAGATGDPPALLTTVSARCPSPPGALDKAPPPCSPFDAEMPAGDKDAGAPRDEDAGTMTGPMPGAMPGEDAGETRPPGVVGPAGDDDSGCSVAVGPGPHRASFLALGLVWAGAALRRRLPRKRRR